MNTFTQQSIALANHRDYLDQLFRVYPFSPDNIRKIDEDVWNEAKHYYNINDNANLIHSLLKLPLFSLRTAISHTSGWRVRQHNACRSKFGATLDCH